MQRSDNKFEIYKGLVDIELGQKHISNIMKEFNELINVSIEDSATFKNRSEHLLKLFFAFFLYLNNSLNIDFSGEQKLGHSFSHISLDSRAELMQFMFGDYNINIENFNVQLFESLHEKVLQLVIDSTDDSDINHINNENLKILHHGMYCFISLIPHQKLQRTMPGKVSSDNIIGYFDAPLAAINNIDFAVMKLRASVIKKPEMKPYVENVIKEATHCHAGFAKRPDKQQQIVTMLNQTTSVIKNPTPENVKLAEDTATNLYRRPVSALVGGAVLGLLGAFTFFACIGVTAASCGALGPIALPVGIALSGGLMFGAMAALGATSAVAAVTGFSIFAKVNFSAVGEDTDAVKKSVHELTKNAVKISRPTSPRAMGA